MLRTADGFDYLFFFFSFLFLFSFYPFHFVTSQGKRVLDTDFTKSDNNKRSRRDERAGK